MQSYLQEFNPASLLFLFKRIYGMVAQVATLLTTYPALQNKYYLEEIDTEITMDALFR